MKIGSLFSGAGMLDYAVEHVFGGETVWHCEVDKAASKVLAHRWPGVPNLEDITKVDWAAIEPVDILCGGWPCQPFSSAGSKKGAEDDRALWPYVARAIRTLRPRYVVLENVSAVLRCGEFDRVAGDLASSGYEFAWTCLRASDVGAPHQRERLFVTATDTGAAGRGWGTERDGVAQQAEPEQPQRPHVDRLAVETNGLLPTPRATDRFGAGRHGDGGLDLRTTIAERAGTDQWHRHIPAITHWENLTRPAPSPADAVLTRDGNTRINPAFSEWMLGWPAGWVTDPAIGISRGDQLRIIGNGVVPACASAALSWLLGVSVVEEVTQ